MTHIHETRTALILGATGGIGGETAAALLRHGWTVRGLSRRATPPSAGIEWVTGDATSAADVARAAQGVRLIVHAANPAGYRNWDQLVLPMLDNTIAAAQAQGARILLPGTIYNFGADAFPLLQEDSPQHPASRKGRIRVAMESRLEAAARAGVPVLIVRAGDFFGPRPGNNWFSQGVVKPGAPLKAIVDPVRNGASHAWAYLPDLGEAMARLLDREDRLEPFARFHFSGFQLAPGELAQAIRRVVGDPRLPVRRFPWAALVLLSPFVRLLREMAELRYLWRTSIALDGSRLKAFLGDGLPATPLDQALHDTLVGLGCMK